jgi:Carboxypeptidase regulatory-like domain/TonB dependent receptor
MRNREVRNMLDAFSSPLPLAFMMVLTVALGFLVPATVGQTTSATILGMVTDQSGAVIPGAKVTVLDLGTSQTRTTTTNSNGDYTFPDLVPGNYQVRVEAGAFKTFLHTGIVLNARTTIRVDAKLTVGRTEQTVEVKAGAPVITTETGTVSAEVQKQAITDLPLNYRAVDTSPLSLVATVPGVQVDPNFNISVAGNHPAQNETSVDGFSVVDVRYNGPLRENLPSTEALSEVKVTEQLGAAEYGQIGDISFISRGGTNNYHGTLFEYLQNNSFDATPLFATTKPPKHANDFGGSLGGPVLFPGYSGKGRTFFYADFEKNLYHTSDVLVEGVPTVAMRSGDFSSLCSTYSAAGICTDPTGTQLTNPFTGKPYPDNKLPAVNPVSQRVLNTFYPLPNFNSGDIASNYRAIEAAPINTTLFDIRIDQKLTAKQSVYGRFSWKNDTATNPLGLLQGNESIGTDPRSFGANYTYVIKPNVLNEFRFGYSRETDSFIFDGFPNGQQLVSQTLGLQLPGPFPPGSAIPGFQFLESPLTWTANNRQENRTQHRFQFDDNVSWVHGRHSMKFGTDIRRLSLQDFVQFIGADDFGVFQFSGQFTGDDIADFELGLPSQSSIAVTGPYFNTSETAFAFFAQDQFQVTPKLTINYGLRYEVHPPFFDKTLQMTNFDPANGDVVVPNAASLKLAAPGFLEAINACPGYAGLTTPCTHVLTAAEDNKPEHLRNTDWTKILPRLNFAYRLSEKSVVRAGFGMYDETLTGLTFYSLVGIHTANVQAFQNSITNGVASIQFPQTVAGGIGSVPPPGTEDFRTATQFNLHDPYGEQWSLSLEHQLGSNTGIRLTYTGLRSVGLLTTPDLNSVHPSTQPYNPALKPYPNFRIVYQTANGAESIYNGADLVVTRRFSHGFTLQSSYTFAKNLSDAEGSGAAGPNGGFVGENGPFIADRFNYKYDYGDVNFTPRHRWLTTYVYELPFGNGKQFGNNMPRIANAILGGWQTMGLLLLQSGPYLTPFYFGDPTHDPSGIGLYFKDPGERPDRICNGNISNPTVNGYFNQACFIAPLTGLGRFGDSGVGILKGPGTVILDAGLAKSFAIHEQLRLRFEATANNIANHANLGTPDMNTTESPVGSDFGVIHGIQNAEGAGARTIQLGLRLTF